MRPFLWLLAAIMFTACGSGGSGPEIREARIGQPTGPNAALYFTASGGAETDRLVGATTDVAASVALHESTVADDGTVSMHHVPALDLPANGALVLEPGGYHLMLVDVEPLEVGETVEVVLMWETAGEITAMAEVVEPAETVSAP